MLWVYGKPTIFPLKHQATGGSIRLIAVWFNTHYGLIYELLEHLVTGSSLGYFNQYIQHRYEKFL